MVLEPDESLELRQLDLREVMEASPKAFGGQTQNEEVVRLRREERGMPRAWFGPEAVEEAGMMGSSKLETKAKAADSDDFGDVWASQSEDGYSFKRAIVNKLPIAQHKEGLTSIGWTYT